MLILEIAGILFTALVSMVIAYFVGRKQGLENKTEDFRCLYCDTLVIGAKSMDKMVHIMCIDRAPEDIEALKKKVIAPEDEYFSEYFRRARKEGEPYGSFNLDNNSWWAWGLNVYRNGVVVGNAYHKTKEGIENTSEQIIALDKHKRKTKALN